MLAGTIAATSCQRRRLSQQQPSTSRPLKQVRLGGAMPEVVPCVEWDVPEYRMDSFRLGLAQEWFASTIERFSMSLAAADTSGAPRVTAHPPTPPLSCLCCF